MYEYGIYFLLGNLPKKFGSSRKDSDSVRSYIARNTEIIIQYVVPILNSIYRFSVFDKEMYDNLSCEVLF